MRTYTAVDVGGTAIKYSLITEDAHFLDKGEIPTPRDNLDNFICVISKIHKKYSSQSDALVMSAPGLIDPYTGYCCKSSSLRYLEGIGLKMLFEEVLGTPFSIENDANSAALGELWKGSLSGIRNGCVVTLGTSIGSGIILNGNLYRGKSFSAGEMASICTDWNDPLKPNSDWYINGRVSALCLRYANIIGADPLTMNGRAFFAALSSGDSIALQVLKGYCRTISSGLYAIHAILDMERISLGGGISSQPLLIKNIKDEFRDILKNKGNPLGAVPEIVPCTFGNDANMVGALYHYLFH